MAPGTSTPSSRTSIKRTECVWGMGAAIVHPIGHVKDVDGDGDLGLVVHFKRTETGIACGDTAATLTGETLGGQAFSGTDAIETVGCN